MKEISLPCGPEELGLDPGVVPGIIMEDGAGDIPLATLLANMIKGNVEKSRGKARLFVSMKTSIYLSVTDAAVETSMVFDKGILKVSPGKMEKPDVSIIADSNTLMGLVTLKTYKSGIPRLFDKNGRKILKKLLKRELRLKGLIRNGGSLARFGALLSPKG